MFRVWLTSMMIFTSVASLSAAEDAIHLFATKYCTDCHNSDDAEADVDLSSISADTLSRNPQFTRQLIEVLDTHEMPPQDELQPTKDQRQEILARLSPIMHKAVAHTKAHVRAPIRRMNRFQYNNAVVDLFQLNCIVFTLPERAMRVHNNYFKPETGKMPANVSVGNRPLGKSQMIEPRLAGVAAFPQDLRAENGYDNRADHLSLSPLLMDEFIKLGSSITQSPDFNSRHVKIWKSFFAPPAKDTNLEKEVRNRLQSFLTKAFRRPADANLVDRYTAYVIRNMKKGVDFTEAMKSIAAATISSPRFLYLYNKGDSASLKDKSEFIDDYELASRLSFFLWGSIPDDELLTLAAAGELSKPKVFNHQIDRMLKDRKLKRFCDSFPSQWLQLDRIISSSPSREKFPDFYFSKYRVSMHMMMEPLLVFETVLIEDLPITQLIDSDFTYRSAKLEHAYGELRTEGKKSNGGGVTVLKFNRVPIKDRRLGGVITNLAVMTMTSGTERTKPITRGAWVAAVIFNNPPKPPPADVPPLSEKADAADEKLTLRERLALHRKRNDCRGCHEKIDPLGFALENFDAVGKWRNNYENGLPVDVSGKLLHQHEFGNIIEFKEAILTEKDRFTKAFAKHLLSFALARELGLADDLAIEEISKAVAKDGYKMKTLIRHIILSKPFRTKS